MHALYSYCMTKLILHVDSHSFHTISALLAFSFTIPRLCNRYSTVEQSNILKMFIILPAELLPNSEDYFFNSFCGSMPPVHACRSLNSLYYYINSMHACLCRLHVQNVSTSSGTTILIKLILLPSPYTVAVQGLFCNFAIF